MPDLGWLWTIVSTVVLSIVLGITANLLTPKVQDWWARGSAQRAERRIRELEAERELIKGYAVDRLDFLLRVALQLLVMIVMIGLAIILAVLMALAIMLGTTVSGTPVTRTLVIGLSLLAMLALSTVLDMMHYLRLRREIMAVRFVKDYEAEVEARIAAIRSRGAPAKQTSGVEFRLLSRNSGAVTASASPIGEMASPTPSSTWETRTTAPRRPDIATVTALVKDTQHSAIANATILLVASNGTYTSTTSNYRGVAELTLPRQRGLTLFCAHDEFLAFLGADFEPMPSLTIELASRGGVGSIICPNGEGFIPGLQGRLNPIRDTSDRLYLYADNIAIDGGKPQPVHFQRGELLLLEDAKGTRVRVKVLEIIGKSSLIEFTREAT